MFTTKDRFLAILALIVVGNSFSGCDDKESKDPIAHYKFDGNASDAIGGHHGAAASLQFASGVSGNAAMFNGVSSQVGVASGFDLREKTISVWFNSNLSSEGLRVIYALDNPDLSYGMNIISVEQTGEDLVVLFNASRELFSKSIEAGKWYHVALVTSNLEYRYYLNGAEVKSGSIPGFIASGNGTTDAMIGCSRAFDRFFDGKLDEMKVYDRALSAGEIETLANEFAN